MYFYECADLAEYLSNLLQRGITCRSYNGGELIIYPVFREDNGLRLKVFLPNMFNQEYTYEDFENAIYSKQKDYIAFQCKEGWEIVLSESDKEILNYIMNKFKKVFDLKIE